MDNMEEISLRELIESLLKGRNAIILLVIISMGIALGASFYINETQATAKTIISLNFEGIEKGLNPDGTKFDISMIKSPVVVNGMLEEMGLNRQETSVDDIRRNIETKAIVPNNIVDLIRIKREEGEDYRYYPNEFEISLKTSSSVGLDKDISSKLLNNLVKAYTEYFNELYSDESVLANAVGDIDYSQYDYPEVSTVIHNQLNIMGSYLDGRISESKDFRAKSTGLTFGDIRESIKIIDTVDLNKLDSIIGAFNLTKDKEKLIINYEYAIKRNQLTMSKKESESTVSREMMNNFTQEQNTLLIPGISGEGLEINNSSSFYDELAARATDAGVESQNKVHDVNYILGEIDRLRNDTVSLQLKNKAQIEVQALITSISTKLNHWIDLTNETADEYYEKKLSNAIMRISPVEIYGNSNMKLNLAIAGVLGLMIGVFFVFFREYWRNSAPQFGKDKTEQIEISSLNIR